jgi:hypothetical protein
METSHDEPPARRAGGEEMNKELIELLREARHLISDGYGAQLYGEPYLSDALDRIDAALAQPAALREKYERETLEKLRKKYSTG